MNIARHHPGLGCAGAMLLAAGTACAQNFPNKPIRLVTSTPGGGGDLTSRVIAPGLTTGLGQTVIVDNRGANFIPIEAVAKAPPDGYTLLVYGSIMWLAPYLYDKVSWEPLKDFAPITQITSSPTLLVVHPSVKVKSVKDLIALAKSQPGQLNYGSGGTGSATQIATEQFKAMAGVRIEQIPYKGNGPALLGLVAGETQMMFATPGETVPQVKAGKLNAIAVTSLEKSQLFPDLPTVSASGLPGFEATSQFCLFAPGKTPVEIINRLNKETVNVLSKQDIKEKFLGVGVEPVGNTPEQLGAYVKNQMDKLGKVIKDAGIKAQ